MLRSAQDAFSSGYFLKDLWQVWCGFGFVFGLFVCFVSPFFPDDTGGGAVPGDGWAAAVAAADAGAGAAPGDAPGLTPRCVSPCPVGSCTAGIG